VQYLVEEQKADLFSKSYDGKGCLELARQGEGVAQKEVVDYLKYQMAVTAGSLDHYLDATEAFER